MLPLLVKSLRLGEREKVEARDREVIVTRADYPRALEPEKIIELARKAGLESEAAIPVEFAFMRALENSEKDGSIVLSAGSMFVTAEAMRAWNKIFSVAETASEAESK